MTAKNSHIAEFCVHTLFETGEPESIAHNVQRAIAKIKTLPGGGRLIPLESVATLTSGAPAVDPERYRIIAPRSLKWDGKVYNFEPISEMNDKPWRLLIYLYERLLEGVQEVSITDVGKSVWKKRARTYDNIKPSLSRLRKALAEAVLPFTWEKVTGQERLIYRGPPIQSSVSQ